MFRGRAALFDRLSGVFDNALIDRRSTVAPIDWYREPHGWQERTELYVAATEAMFEDAATKAIAKAECLTMVPVVVDPAATIQYVLAGKADIAAGDWYRTAERAKVIGLSYPTYLDQIVTSLKTVALGFLIATLIAVPLGIACGLSPTVNGAFNPLIQIFKPVSPLASSH